MLIGGRGLVMDYRYAKFGDLSFTRFGFIVRADKHTHTHTESRTDAAKRFTRATVAVVSKYKRTTASLPTRLQTTRTCIPD